MLRTKSVLKPVKMLSVQLCILLTLSGLHLGYTTEEKGQPTYCQPVGDGHVVDADVDVISMPGENTMHSSEEN